MRADYHRLRFCSFSRDSAHCEINNGFVEKYNNLTIYHCLCHSGIFFGNEYRPFWDVILLRHFNK